LTKDIGKKGDKKEHMTSQEQLKWEKTEADKMRLNEYIHSLMHHDQDEMPFSKKEQLLAQG
jgi:hypothetical protein